MPGSLGKSRPRACERNTRWLSIDLSHSTPQAQVVESSAAENPPVFPEPPLGLPSAETRGVPERPDVPQKSVPDASPPEVVDELSAAARPARSAAVLIGLLRHWSIRGKSSSWVASALVHASIIVLLSLLLATQRGEGPLSLLVGTVSPSLEDDLDLEIGPLPVAGGMIGVESDPATTLGLAPDVSTVTVASPLSTAAASAPIAETGAAVAMETVGQPLASHGGSMEGRSAANRRSLALAGGGNLASESAVERGLAWLAAHQFEDGGWRFDLKTCPQCAGFCGNSGYGQSTTASTGLALLCFLGAGYTHQEGPYQETITQGLYYLNERMLITSMGGDLRDISEVDQAFGNLIVRRKSGSMYSHGIATLALCEAYAMTRDRELAEQAQQAVDFIVNAQHDQGGWRYEPLQPGDTTITGWQVTALKSALLGRLKVPREVWYRVSDFLDSVQIDTGPEYGYTNTSRQTSTTAMVGAFCRMMLGWPRDQSSLRRGVSQLRSANPHQHHMYHNYYASQVLHHYGGPVWERWNPKMRDYLVGSQSAMGHESGSWYFDEQHSKHGGRLYTTAMAILTLEVYYRHMPMYQSAFVNEAP